MRKVLALVLLGSLLALARLACLLGAAYPEGPTFEAQTSEEWLARGGGGDA